MNEILVVLAIIAVIIVSTTYTMHLTLGFPPKSGWYGIGVICLAILHGAGGTVLVHVADYLQTGRFGMFMDFTVLSSLILFTALSIVVCVAYVLVHYLKGAKGDGT